MFVKMLKISFAFKAQILDDKYQQFVAHLGIFKTKFVL